MQLQEQINLKVNKTIKSINIEIIKMSGFEINQKDISTFNNKSPGVYAFYDKKRIYIGESSQPMNRLKQHKADNKLKENDNILIFRSREFNKSAIYDIETRLIDYMNADESLDLENTKINQKDHEYFMKDDYIKTVDKIWNFLLIEGVAKYEVIDIINLEIFKYSPFKQLNNEQSNVVNDITAISGLNKGNTTLIKGFAGTGKSIVASTLVKGFIDKNKTVAYISGNKPTWISMKNVFKRMIKNNDNLFIGSSSKFIKMNKKFDLVIIDEAHRLRYKEGFQYAMGTQHIGYMQDELDLLLKLGKDKVVLYDPGQRLRAGDIPQDKFLEILGNVKVYELKDQMRMNNAFNYNNFINKLLDGDTKSKFIKEDKYKIEVKESFADMYNILKKESQIDPLVRLTSGYTRKYISDPKKDKQRLKFDFDIEGIKLQWNKNENNWINSKAARNLEEVAYYNTVQGQDISINGVIIGKDLRMDNEGNLFVDEKYIVNQYDRDKKDVLNREAELLKYVMNRYRVLLTRGSKATYIYVEDKNLRNFLMKIFNQEHKK